MGECPPNGVLFIGFSIACFGAVFVVFVVFFVVGVEVFVLDAEVFAVGVGVFAVLFVADAEALVVLSLADVAGFVEALAVLFSTAVAVAFFFSNEGLFDIAASLEFVFCVFFCAIAVPPCAICPYLSLEEKCSGDVVLGKASGVQQGLVHHVHGFADFAQGVVGLVVGALDAALQYTVDNCRVFL